MKRQEDTRSRKSRKREFKGRKTQKQTLKTLLTFAFYILKNYD